MLAQSAFRPQAFAPEPSKPPRAAENLKDVAGQDFLPYEALKGAAARPRRAGGPPGRRAGRAARRALVAAAAERRDRVRGG